MRRSVFVLIVAVLLAVIGCEQSATQNAPQTKAERDDTRQLAANQEAESQQEPLLLDDEPLLLEDGPGEDALAEGGADNSRCFVCHINYTQEDIAVTHAKAGMGCKDCHGQSDEHIADESWAWGGNGTAPDKMYPHSTINPFCMGCHPQDKLPAASHEVVFANTAQQKYCTDCHGEHRLTNRKCKWK